MNMKQTNNRWNNLIQFIKFGIVGLSNTMISYVIYAGTLLLMQKKNILPQIDYLLAQLIGFMLSVLWSFYWNRRFVFREGAERVAWPKALLKTYLSYAFTGIFLNSVLSFVWVEYLQIPKLIAPIINLIVSVPLNFILNKFWAFGEK